MKELLKLGNALSAAAQKTIIGGDTSVCTYVGQSCLHPRGKGYCGVGGGGSFECYPA